MKRLFECQKIIFRHSFFKHIGTFWATMFLVFNQHCFRIVHKFVVHSVSLSIFVVGACFPFDRGQFNALGHPRFYINLASLRPPKSWILRPDSVIHWKRQSDWNLWILFSEDKDFQKTGFGHEITKRPKMQ